MLDAEVNCEYKKGKNDRSHHHNDSGISQFVPSRPRYLLSQLSIRLFKIVDKSSHLYI